MNLFLWNQVQQWICSGILYIWFQIFQISPWLPCILRLRKVFPFNQEHVCVQGFASFATFWKVTADGFHDELFFVAANLVSSCIMVGSSNQPVLNILQSSAAAWETFMSVRSMSSSTGCVSSLFFLSNTNFGPKYLGASLLAIPVAVFLIRTKSPCWKVGRRASRSSVCNIWLRIW